MRSAAGLLFTRGRRRVVLLSVGPASLVTSGSLLYQGYIEALDDAGIPLIRELVIDAPSTKDSVHASEIEIATRLHLGISFDGVVAVGDAAALGAARALAEHGLEPGTDVLVIGLGNSTLARRATPSITSVERHPALMAERAVELLLAQIERGLAVRGGAALTLGPNPPIPFELVERDTTLGQRD